MVGKNHKRNLMERLKKLGVKQIDESIDLPAIYSKYKGKCQSCGRQTAMGIHQTVDYSASIEHIKPIREGGSHTWENVTLFCDHCNKVNNHRKQVEAVSEKCYTFSIFGFKFSFKWGGK